MKQFILLLLTSIWLFVSCIQDEAPNAEADILTCEVTDQSILKQDPVIENSKITIWVYGGTDLNNQTITFTVTAGATIADSSIPVSSIETDTYEATGDFSSPQTCTVQSEDKNWTKTYTINFISNDIPTFYSFETYGLYDDGNDQYHIITEEDEDGNYVEWASGNAGYAIIATDKQPEEYPTAINGNGYEGKCVVLQTISTGEAGMVVNMPIAAGNLFLGHFDATNAITQPMESTQFGLPFNKIPVELRGWYKYQRGTQFYHTERNSDGTVNITIEENNSDDIWDIYAVLYEPDSNSDYLNGNTILSSSKIIGRAYRPASEREEASEWTEFSIPFVLEKEIDQTKLKNYKYKLAIVCTSSREGANFSGAVGSTLWIDNLELVCEE